MRKAVLSCVVVVALLALLAATTAWAKETGTTSAKGTSVVISTKTLPKLGTVLVNSKGMTLYVFVPDKQKKVTCVSTCAVVWPPVFLPNGGKAVVKGLALSKLLGSDPDPAGGRVVTYNGWPLYLYVSDTAPGTANGQGLNLNGGLWYVLTPAGKEILTKP
jgi:predicted lipoprotein with Yx(FWY)xxD motif